MSVELVLPLVGFFALLVAGLVWIAVDADTAYIFDVFGKNFNYVWHQSGRRWKYTFMYGWRLIALLLLISACAYLAWLWASSLSWTPASLTVFAVMTAMGICLVPWIKIASRLRFQRKLRSTAVALTPVAQQLAATADISSVLDEARYATAPNWSAWHPKSAKDWPVVVPVAYVHAPPSATVLFPLDWECFLAWNLLDQLPTLGSALPFHGPCDSTFLLRRVTPLRGVDNWSLVYAEFG
jgi:hypothetical protein